jgi:hypothetical protein
MNQVEHSNNAAEMFHCRAANTKVEGVQLQKHTSTITKLGIYHLSKLPDLGTALIQKHLLPAPTPAA